MDTANSPLITDLYQLTMLQAYLEQDMTDTAAFEFFVRRLPPGRNFLVAAGLGPVLQFLSGMGFSREEVEYAAGTGRFSGKVIKYLESFRFEGEVDALPEGTVFFPGEPVVRITAPLPAAQLVETRIISILHLNTLLASKAARCRLAAKENTLLVDFGLRRAHGAEAGIAAARSSYIAGFAGSSTVIAEPLYGIPVYGTMAHSFVEAHGGEKQAFIDFARANPGNVTLLIDTYDTLKGAEKTVEVARQLAREGITVRAVRLDSGDLLDLSVKVRQILDAGGFPRIGIFVSGDMDEYSIRDLLERGAPINGFGVGTKLDTSADAPYLECAYKLMEYAGVPRFKKSRGKATLPGRKQVFRKFNEGVMSGDVIGLEDESLEGQPLLERYMSEGRICGQLPSLQDIARRASEQLRALPGRLKILEAGQDYPVGLSAGVIKLRDEAELKLAQTSYL
ncbi:MAG: nicotinate phosphoribosyltransferase [Syntrophaceae bacterium]